MPGVGGTPAQETPATFPNAGMQPTQAPQSETSRAVSAGQDGGGTRGLVPYFAVLPDGLPRELDAIPLLAITSCERA